MGKLFYHDRIRRYRLDGLMFVAVIGLSGVLYIVRVAHRTVRFRSYTADL